MAQETKPPLGLIPEWRNIEIRALAISDAINRAHEADAIPNPAWNKEFNFLAARCLEIKGEVLTIKR